MDEHSLARKIRDSLTNPYNAYSLKGDYKAISIPVGSEKPTYSEPGYEHNKPGEYSVDFYIRTSDSEGYEISVKKIGLWGAR